MWRFIVAFAQAQFVRILQILAIVGVVAAILFGAKNAGRNAEKVERMKQVINEGRRRNEIEARNRARGGDIRDRLRKQRDEISKL